MLAAAKYIGAGLATIGLAGGIKYMVDNLNLVPALNYPLCWKC